MLWRVLPIAPVLAALTLAAPALAAPKDAEVRLTVSPACGARSNCFASLQQALDAGRGHRSDQWIVIDLAAGDYYEKVTIARSRTRIRGAGADRTRLHYDAVAETAGKHHRRNWGTPGSATLTINADEVTVEGLKVENTFDYLTNDALPDGDPKKISNSQGVALLLDIASDRVLLDKVALLGYQDTLFTNGGRAVIRDSLIAGNIDFIFGDGRLLIEGGEIRTRNRGARLAPGEFHSFVVAPSTPSVQPIGIVIHGAHLTRETGVPDGSVALGRPWHPTTTFADGRYADPLAIGQASFIDCVMDAHIHRDHWTSMNGTARDGSKSAIFEPQDARFFEVGSTGPGAARRDIGLRWKEALTLMQVRQRMFWNWPDGARVTAR